MPAHLEHLDAGANRDAVRFGVSSDRLHKPERIAVSFVGIEDNACGVTREVRTGAAQILWRQDLAPDAVCPSRRVSRRASEKAPGSEKTLSSPVRR